MYHQRKFNHNRLSINKSYQGERIEQKIARIVNNKEPITDGAPLIYTERKDGVGAEYNIRTDRFEVAIDAMDKVASTLRAKREQKPSLGEEAKEGMKKEGETGGQSTQATQ